MSPRSAHPHERERGQDKWLWESLRRGTPHCERSRGTPLLQISKMIEVTITHEKYVETNCSGGRTAHRALGGTCRVSAREVLRLGMALRAPLPLRQFVAGRRHRGLCDEFRKISTAQTRSTGLE